MLQYVDMNTLSSGWEGVKIRGPKTARLVEVAAIEGGTGGCV
jgi:hypothetical protein